MNAKKGITPVVAMVLLLMMTVAAAGAAFAWTQGILSGQQQEATQALNTEVAIRGLNCAAGGASPELDFFLNNVGSTTVSASAPGSVTVYLYSVSTGNLVTTESTSHSNDLAPNDNWDGTLDFSGADMTAGIEYRVEFEFSNQGSYTVSDTCQAS
ncbi:MAG: archaellin/type IV pilin N-terminal domain-containing protein [Candidatus Nanohaloarchaea archaeon]|nr:archaellin/type IV pilin N-terminal domain-containing protein [Candidatus Nanohaloarchaea archaeon]